MLNFKSANILSGAPYISQFFNTWFKTFLARKLSNMQWRSIEIQDFLFIQTPAYSIVACEIYKIRILENWIIFINYLFHADIYILFSCFY